MSQRAEKYCADIPEKGGIDLNKRDAEGNTPLYYACLKGYRDIVILLLDNGADAAVANNRSESPLHAAARSGNKEIISRLVEKEIDLNTTDNEGRTPLLCLLDNKRTDAALFLVDKGADTDIADSTGHKAIDYATAHGLREVVARLSVEKAATSSAIHRSIKPCITGRAKLCAHCSLLQEKCLTPRMTMGKRP